MSYKQGREVLGEVFGFFLYLLERKCLLEVNKVVKYGKECHTFQPQYKTLFGEKKLHHVCLGNGGL